MSDVLPKRATWLELLYDVAFVALIAQLTYLAADYFHSLTGIAHVFIVGYTIFLTWWTTTVNRNLQQHETVTDKIIIQVQLIGAFLMSLTMPGIFEGSYTGYFVALAVLRLLQVAMILRMYRLHPELNPTTKNVTTGTAIAAGIWLAASITPEPLHFVVAGAALLLDVFTPLTKGKGNTVRFLNVHHMQERLGLFFMLVLGESLLVVALANTAATLDVVRPVFLFCGVITIIALWWIYFEYMDRCAHERRPKNLFIYLHAHGFLFGAIILLAAAFKNFLKHGSPNDEDLTLYFVAVVGILVTITAIRIALHGFVSKQRMSQVLLILIVLGGLYFMSISNEAFATHSVLLSTLLLVVVTAHDWRRGSVLSH